MFPFGHGLSYTTFAYRDLEVSGGDTVTASLTVENTGDRAGAAVAQVYLVDAPDRKRMRLLGFERVELEPGASKRVAIEADPRLLARFDGEAGQWRITGGTYMVAAGHSAGDLTLQATVDLADRAFGR
jgi:beta-glucosidase